MEVGGITNSSFNENTDSTAELTVDELIDPITAAFGKLGSDPSCTVHGAFIHTEGKDPRYLRYGDPAISGLRAEGWIEIGLWDGEFTEIELPCGGPIMARVIEP